MTIKDQKDLKKLIQLCRTMGVDAIEADGIKISLGPTPTIIRAQKYISNTQTPSATYTPGGITEDVRIPTDRPTEEQMLFYSVRGLENNEHDS